MLIFFYAGSLMVKSVQAGLNWFPNQAKIAFSWLPPLKPGWETSVFFLLLLFSRVYPRQTSHREHD